MSRPLIAILTDFGLRDHYVGTMKAVALGVCPEASFVDITHEIPPQDVLAGALELSACYRFFPAGTVFLVVVDPGVGSSRRGIAAEAGDYRFVAPDNGVLTGVFRETAPRRVVDLTERRYARATVSRTFEGRDRFAPAAAWLARGIELGALGRTLVDWHALEIPAPVARDVELAGEVLRVDHFGNLITNIDHRGFDRFVGDRPLQIRAGSHPIERLVSTYGEAAQGEVCALFGSSEHLEIAANGGSAAGLLGLGRGAPVVVRRLEP
jgi:S-adenosylmethionine hydrolase